MRAYRTAITWVILAASATLWAQQQPDKARQIFDLTNHDRQEHGLPLLKWNDNLAAAAATHGDRMASQGSLSHQFSGEPDLMARASQAGAHFQAIAENVASGPSPEAIEKEWMNSTAHRTNILDPQMNQIGIAVVIRDGGMYAVEDFANGAEALTTAKVEDKVSALLQAQNITPMAATDPTVAAARQACRANQGIPQGAKSIVRFETSDLTQLPSQLADQIRSGKFSRAAVGACTPSAAQGHFTVYRVSVLLY